ncbi:MAG: hypothetical protein ACP5MH_11940 [Thermoproteus sp.]
MVAYEVKESDKKCEYFGAEILFCPVYIDFDELSYEDTSVGKRLVFKSRKDLIQYINDVACKKHIEPVIHAANVTVRCNGKIAELEDDPYIGIPVKEILDVCHE